MSDEARRTAETAISVKDALRTSLAENTRTAYRKGWNRFAAYCREVGRDPMAATPGDVAGFLVAMASEPRSHRAGSGRGKPLAIGTIRVLLAAINRTFGEADRSSPARDLRVAAVMRGLSRMAAVKPRRVKALREHEIASILAYCDELGACRRRLTIALRDAAVIAVGFAAALRRSEICALRFGDIEFLRRGLDSPGMFIHIRRSKTDQLGSGQRVAVPEGERIRPVGRLREWLRVAGISRGPLFRTMRRAGHVQEGPLHPTDVARIVKRCVEAIGLDPAEYSGHSLRAGFVTCAAAHHARLDKIMEVTRHSSVRTLLRYIRQADAFDDHAGDAFL